MSTQPISSSASLTSLAEQFTQWRTTRSRRRSPVPTALRQLALELLSAYSKSQVIKTLGINSTMLKNWQQALGGGESMTVNSSPSLIRRIALNLLHQEKTHKRGIENKRKRAGWNQDYLLKVLTADRVLKK